MGPVIVLQVDPKNSVDRITTHVIRQSEMMFVMERRPYGWFRKWVVTVLLQVLFLTPVDGGDWRVVFSTVSLRAPYDDDDDDGRYVKEIRY